MDEDFVTNARREKAKVEDQEEDFVRDARKGKAKVEQEEDPNILLPKSVPNTYNNLNADIIYLKLVGPQRDAEAFSTESPEGVKKILFRFRNKELSRICGKEDARLINIQNASKATIGILSDAPARLHRHLYLELIGTANEVKIAELLITDVITEGYNRPYIPRALMPINICHQAIPTHLMKIIPLLGINGDNLVKLESESGTWIEVDTYSNEGNSMARIVKLYGEELDVTNAIAMMNNKLYGKSKKAKDDIDMLLEELAYGDQFENMDLEDEKERDGDEDYFGSEDGDDDMEFDDLGIGKRRCIDGI